MNGLVSSQYIKTIYKYIVYILSITPAFYFVIPLSVSPIVIVIMYHLVPTPESFEIIPFSIEIIRNSLKPLCQSFLLPPGFDKNSSFGK
jgi:hypothetical protein